MAINETGHQGHAVKYDMPVAQGNQLPASEPLNMITIDQDDSVHHRLIRNSVDDAVGLNR